MSFTEKEVFEALGLEPPAAAAEGAQEQEVADPAAQVSQAEDTNAGSDAGAGAQEQDVADPAGDDANTASGTETEPTAGSAEPEEPASEADSGTGADNTPLTTEQRRQNAARRRQQEQKAAIDQAVSQAVAAEKERAAKEMEAFFASVGMKNTITGQPITNMDEFKAWQEQHSAAKLDKDLKAGKLTPDGLAAAISNHPTVKKAAEMVQEAERAKENATKQIDMQRINAELAEIHKMDPSINEVGDLLKMPKAAEFREKIAKGYSFIDAFRLIHQKERDAQVAEAAKQQALNNSRGKEHLNATGNSRGGGAISVPSADMELYRLLNPGASEAQIQAHYNKYKK